MTPLVSVITPVYNRPDSIVEAIESLQAQTLPDFEAIVVDDGSDDNTADVVAAMAASDPRIRLIRAEHRGRSAARNPGLDAARGEWVMFLDSDDLLLPGAIEHLVACAEQSSHGAAYGAWRHIDQDGRVTDEELISQRATQTIDLEVLLGGNGFVIHSQIVRRQVVGDLRFDTELDLSEDRNFWLHLAERGVAWTPTPVCVCEYRMTSCQLNFEVFRAESHVIFSAFDRARQSGWGNRSVDVSRKRESELVATRAYEFAHRKLLDDDTSASDSAVAAVRIVEKRFGSQAVQLMPERAASSAFHLLPFSDCAATSEWPSNLERYWAAIGPWWSRCVDEGWVPPSFILEAREKLIELLVNARDDLPQRVLDRCNTTRRIVLLGFGRNGIRIAEEMARREIPVIVRDDNLSPEKAAERFPHAPVTLIRNDESYLASDLHVMSLLYDDVYLSLLPQGLDFVRWRDAFGEIDQEFRNRMNSVWPKPRINTWCDRVKVSII